MIDILLSFFRLFRGYVDFYAGGKFPERFMNVTARYGINIWNAAPEDGGISGSMYLCDYRRIRPAARKSGVRVRVRRRHGIPFFISRCKPRAGLAAGALAGVIVLLILSNFIWSVRIVGSENISDAYLLDVLRQNGVSVGAYKNNLDVQKTERKILLRVKQIGWMSINITGNVVNAEIKEKTEKPFIDSGSKPCNIKAKCDGVITSIKATSGAVEALIGSGVTKGDLLVSGITETKLETTRYVRAKAEVFADVREERIFKIPKENNYCRLTENETKRYRASFLWLDFPCSLSFDCCKSFVGEVRTQSLLINDVALPVGISTLTTYEAEETRVTTDKKTAERIALNDALLYEAFSKPDSAVVKREINLSEENGGYEARVNYIFNENIAQSVEFEVTEQQ